MIYPSPLAIALMALGVPVALVLAVLAPGLWVLSAGWIAGVAALIYGDAVLGARLRAVRIDVDALPLLYMGASDPLPVRMAFASGPVPDRAELRLEVGERLAPLPTLRLKGFPGGVHETECVLVPVRRGTAEIVEVWARWRGPLGLAVKRYRETLDITMPVTPNTRWVKEEAIRLYSRDADFGIKAQIDRGDGSEFDALREFAAGMDPRAIDWKHSARHRSLLAKEFRTERNHNIVFAFDTGRLMSEPLDGVAKLDRAINAALLLAYVSLRSGDKTMVFGFDAQPGLATGTLAGTRAFPRLEMLASRLDYSSEEANYTLALSDLAGRLNRRSLVILFTDFVDTISAELMLENVRRLADRHLVVFASFEDAALQTFIDAPPLEAEDVGRAVIADGLLRDREIVFRKLQRMGAQVIETTPKGFGAALVSRYLQIKQREML
ncbi:MAG: DUF58 domain-containing protein [Pseudomonadota bacterium]